MMYIKWTDNRDLIITVREAIYRGDNLSQKLIYLLPLHIGEIDVENASVYLCYIRPDGTPDIVMLERSAELYNASYYQFCVPVTCKMTRFAGEVCSWLQIFSGPASAPVTAKSGECALRVLASKNMDDYLCDHQISAIYQLSQDVGDANIQMVQIAEELEGKAEGIEYNKDDNTLHLTIDGEPVGDPVDIGVVMDENDEVINFGEQEDPEKDPDAVIEF